MRRQRLSAFVAAWRWRRKRARWRRVRCPQVWAPRARLSRWWIVLKVNVWAWTWVRPLRFLCDLGVIEEHQFEEAVVGTMPALRRRNR